MPVITIGTRRFRHLLFLISSLSVLLAGAPRPVEARSINGVVIRVDGDEVARAYNGSAFGELAVPPGEIVGPVTVSLLDDTEAEYSVSGVDTTSSGVISDPLVAAYTQLGDFSFEVEGLLDEEMTELVITVFDDGSPVYVSPAIEVHVEEDHQEADGLVIRRNSQDLVHIWRGAVTGFIHVLPSATTDTLELVFLDPDSAEFLPPSEHFTLDWEIDDPAKLSLTPVSDWDFVLNGLSTGPTRLRVIIFHENHADFTSPNIPVLVAATSHVGDGHSGARPPVITLPPPAPNPFTQFTSIRFSLPAAGHARVRMFDAAGRLVRTLHDGVAPAGESVIEWDGRGDGGDFEAGGIYFVQVTAGSGKSVRRIQLVR